MSKTSKPDRIEVYALCELLSGFFHTIEYIKLRERKKLNKEHCTDFKWTIWTIKKKNQATALLFNAWFPNVLFLIHSFHQIQSIPFQFLLARPFASAAELKLPIYEPNQLSESPAHILCTLAIYENGPSICCCSERFLSALATHTRYRTRKKNNQDQQFFLSSLRSVFQWTKRADRYS